MSVCLFHFHTFLFVVNISINLLKNVGNQKLTVAIYFFTPSAYHSVSRDKG